MGPPLAHCWMLGFKYMPQHFAEERSWSPCPCSHFCPSSSTQSWQSSPCTKGAVEAVDHLWSTQSYLPFAPTAEPLLIKGWCDPILVKVRLHLLASHCRDRKVLLSSLSPCQTLLLAPPAGSACMGCFICHLSLGSVSLRKSVSKMKGKAWSLILKELISLPKFIFLSSSIFLPPPILKRGAFLSIFSLPITGRFSDCHSPFSSITSCYTQGTFLQGKKTHFIVPQG